MPATTRTRRRADRPPAELPDAFLPPADELAELKLSPEVAWYLLSRGHKLPQRWQVPLHKTPEPGEVDRDAVFDPARVDRVLAGFRHLRHTKGQWAGRVLEPAVWQLAYILAPTFGWVTRDDELDLDVPADDPMRYVRAVRELYVELSRKNGKSTIVGGVGIYLTCGDGEQGAEVVAAASSRDQARFVFDPVRTLAASSPGLRPYVRPYTTKIIHKATGSEFKVIANAADAQHGANLHGYIVDELHVHKSPDLVETLETGTGSRRQPLGVMITTADDGKPDTIYARKRTRIVQLAQRLFTDASTYGVIWAAADSEEELAEIGLDPFSEEAHRRANPGYGISPSRSYLKRKALAAQQSPAELSAYLRLHLGVRTRQNTMYLPIPAWNRNASIVQRERLLGRTAYGGLDLASTSDFTAFALLVPDDERGGYDVLWRFWLPEGAYRSLIKRTSKLAEVWRREGRFTVTDGDVVDDEQVVADILRDHGDFKIAEIGYDPWNASAITNALTKERVPMVEVRQGYGSLSSPLKELKKLIMSGTAERPMFRHGGHPVARWMVGNLAVAMDPAGNVKPDRARSADKIDGVAAATIALARAMTRKPVRRSAYADGGRLEVV
jgi:phage terminase large subunit-like protein